MATATQRLLQSQPNCVFCGGRTRATTLDHQPAKIFFPNKHRPKGLEFSACGECNSQSRHDEAIVATLARGTGGHRYKTPRNDVALRRAIRAVLKAHPVLLPAITQTAWVEIDGILQRCAVIDGSHPLVETAACRLSAKIALAMYFDEFRTPAPETAVINTFWVHNQNPHEAQSVSRVLAMLEYSKSLKQGRKWDTEDIFFCRYLPDPTLFHSVAIFHESIALIAQVGNGDSAETILPWSKMWQPSPGRGLQPYNRGAAAAAI